MDREIHQGSLALRWAVCRSERGQVGAWKGQLGAGRGQLGAGRGQLGAVRGQVGATKPGHGAKPKTPRPNTVIFVSDLMTWVVYFCATFK